MKANMRFIWEVLLDDLGHRLLPNGGNLVMMRKKKIGISCFGELIAIKAALIFLSDFVNGDIRKILRNDIKIYTMS